MDDQGSSQSHVLIFSRQPLLEPLSHTVKSLTDESAQSYRAFKALTDAAMAHAHAHPIPHDLFTQERPPSPALTNPDMILPYRPLESSSPVPLASSPILLASPLPARPDSAVSLSSTDIEAPVELGVATTVRVSRTIPPIDTAYYGYEHGAPLSDIGEEETPISRKSRIIDSMAYSDPPSPTPRSRRLSTHSSSSTGSELGDWENFDTSRIMDQRLAAELAKVPDDKIDDAESKRNSVVGTSTEDEMALLNERAEKILAQARKRLTTMEDNLSKARHSILLSPRSSPNMSELHQPAGGLYRSISLAGASSRKPRTLHLVARSNSSHSRGNSETNINSGLKRLSMIPEARSASALEYGIRQESPQQAYSSPLTRLGGVSPVSNRSFNSPLRALKEEESTPSTSKTSPDSSGPRGLGINTLAAISREDLSILSSNPSTAIARSPSQMSIRSTKEIREQMTDLRSRISDLKEKAHADSLKRRSLQSLRTSSPFTNAQTPEQWYASAPEYKEGGSPLNTNAGRGWSPSQHKKPIEIEVTPVTPPAQKFLNVEQPSTNDSRLLSEARTDKNTPSLHKSVTVPAVDESRSVVQESLYEDAAQDFDEEEPVAASDEEQIYLNEVLEESLHEIEPEVPEHPDHLLTSEQGAERHEDRYDAFDYENMFLHSALGNYTGTGTRSETPSESDNGSVSTTRVDQNTPTPEDQEDEERTEERDVGESSGTPTPVVEHFSRPLIRPQPTTYLQAPPKPWMKAARSNSMESISTVATFATATEGDAGEEGHGEDGVPSEILGWGNDLGFPQPPKSPGPERSMSIWPTPPMSGRVQQAQTGSPRKTQSQETVVTNGIPTPPAHSPNMAFTTSPRSIQGDNVPSNEAMIDHPANTEILMESLIKLADPEFKIVDGQGSVTFTDIDKDLVLELLRAVGGVCNQILKAERQHETHAAKVLRRRLDASRTLLEGQSGE
ncbi:hypothetical protein LTS13_000363 [Exophiala xenobiotica]|nr:hypothetical protein LTS13_000363 [Exophiala xenobiotica]KAK5403500.1 hypothetical protein LTR79_000253 [Exophiala xenobiotica]KAK5422989.1 hypothetical protein LTR90_002007 [Exophiala xenobiotica]KAK5495515.1 hypothetical protein LTR26_002131 [Exophiala xenobiotica]KAK5514102.1 hypothetical protein LTR07_008133 [Exophiala xenobiotica]